MPRVTLYPVPVAKPATLDLEVLGRVTGTTAISPFSYSLGASPSCPWKAQWLVVSAVCNTTDGIDPIDAPTGRFGPWVEVARAKFNTAADSQLITIFRSVGGAAWDSPLDPIIISLAGTPTITTSATLLQSTSLDTPTVGAFAAAGVDTGTALTLTMPVSAPSALAVFCVRNVGDHITHDADWSEASELRHVITRTQTLWKVTTDTNVGASWVPQGVHTAVGLVVGITPDSTPSYYEVILRPDTDPAINVGLIMHPVLPRSSSILLDVEHLGSATSHEITANVTFTPKPSNRWATQWLFVKGNLMTGVAVSGRFLKWEKVVIGNSNIGPFIFRAEGGGCEWDMSEPISIQTTGAQAHVGCILVQSMGRDIITDQVTNLAGGATIITLGFPGGNISPGSMCVFWVETPGGDVVPEGDWFELAQWPGGGSAQQMHIQWRRTADSDNIASATWPTASTVYASGIEIQSTAPVFEVVTLRPSVGIIGLAELFLGTVGTFVQSLGALTMSAAGTVDVAGSFARALGALTSTASGKVDIAGSFAQTLGALTSTASGKVDIAGSLAQTLGALTMSASAQNAVAATLAQTLGALTVIANSKVDISGTLAQSLGALTVIANGKVDVAAVLAQALGALILAATGAVTAPVIPEAFAFPGEVTAAIQALATVLLADPAFATIANALAALSTETDAEPASTTETDALAALSMQTEANRVL